ncbi:hypothetical protein ACSVIJ_04890 [Pseudomonas sp. NCHU5208]|uniref:hypothetical protein n=1 Tax=unclassified Pseudomonas TaxID=196821 RepID=UPI003F9E8190
MSAITIQILQARSSGSGNHPSLYIPGAGSDRACFQVQGNSAPYPDLVTICSALDRWDRESMLTDYDQVSGMGSFTIVDGRAPASGTVVELPADPFLDDWCNEDDDIWLAEQIEDPNAYPVDRIEDRIERITLTARLEKWQMRNEALQRVESLHQRFMGELQAHA